MEYIEDEFTKEYRQLSRKQKIFAEMLLYSFIAFQTGNKSKIKILKSCGMSMDGKKVVKYEIEVPRHEGKE
ncbi:hypothetical protein IGI37_002096 [Enterococcus sp. AZ194]|uniref:hypothetical protein n=1 Tax=Enterococcus sp. AZ194 TaxID=2774629 RepID=UPI003F26D299